MSNQKYVVLTHSNTLGGTGVRITDIQVEGDDVTLTAEHNGQLKLSLKKCVGSIMATSMGDAVVLAYLQPPVQPMAMGGNFGVRGGFSHGMAGGGLMGFDVESVVESQVSALFQHELTSRLIEPLRQAARDMMGPRPTAAPAYSAWDQPTAASAYGNWDQPNTESSAGQSGSSVLTFSGEKVTWVDIDHPTTKIITDRSEVKVDTARLNVSTHHANSEIKLFTLDRANFDESRVREVANALYRYNPHVSSDYVRYMDIAKGDTQVDNDGRLYIRDTAGELGVITNIVFNDGLLTFSVSVGKQVQVAAAHLGLVGPALQSLPLSTFGILSDPITDAHEVTMVYNAMRQAFPKVAAEYLQFADPNRKPH